MDNQLHQVLRSLCFNTDWNYAIFWKLNHQDPMVLTLEDAYHDSHDLCGPLENKSSNKAGRSSGAQFAKNSHESALAKISGHVYSLGEGVVGQVATTNKHLWISSDKYATDICSSLKYYDGWLTQLSAGIKTIVAVAVVPHGVVQLGSFNSISEDLNLVNHIRDTMVEFHENIQGYKSSIDCSLCPVNEYCRSSVSRNYHDRIRTLDRYMKNEETNILPSVFLSLNELDFSVPLPENCARKTSVSVTNTNQEPEKSISGVCESLDLLESHLAKSLQQLDENVASKKSERSSGFWDSIVGTENNDGLSSLNNYSWEDFRYMPSMFCNHSGNLPQMNVKMDYKRALECHRESNHINKCDPCLNFSAGCELHEALGSKLKKRKTETVVQIPVETAGNSNLTTVNSCAGHLLEAVVAEACRKSTEVKHEDTISGSVKSLSTVEKVFESPSNDTDGISLADYSLQQSSIVEENGNYYASTSGARDGRYQKESSTASYSKCNEQMKRPEKFHTISRSKARYGKKCRRRPRDRQLIQDRIKELRELVPHKSKCSIDSLLEQTIKHILFMQCTTEKAEKLDKCAESKLVDKEIITCGSSSYEQGSSWAMEVENHLRILPVMVENIDTSGQMLIKMLCDDCSPFLEIVKNIRSLGLTIIKSGTEVYDGKILIYYVVEGQNDRNMHRTDVLCSLLQILQQKSYI